MTGKSRKQPVARKPGARRSGADRPVEPEVFPIVCVGASAGGLEALSELLDHLPPDTGMAYALIQHLAPTHNTILPEILSRHTSMPVALATNDMELHRDHVYVIPPGQDMTIFHRRLNLMERTVEGGAHLPIDRFLRSLAADQHARAIGVVLSGSASDGALGLAAVKAEGGITFAQDPASARYDGMPNAAIRANAVDMVLDPPGIARELARLGKHPYVLAREDEAAAAEAPPETEADWMNKIYVLLRAAFGVDFSTYRASTIQRRISRRMALYRLDSLQAYVEYLRERPAEVEDLYHDILIMVTEFFREPEAFDVLAASVLPRILEEKRGDEQVRMWVPGCATGEEPYSIALTLTHVMQEHERELPVKIFATDISERDIEAARAGVFPENKFASVPEQYRHYFTRSDGGYQISKSIRDLIIFARHDVTADPPFSQLDLVSCRNLLIYLGTAAQERVIPVFHYSLRPHGYLLLGQSESIGSATDLFAAVSKKNKIFVKKPGGRRPPAAFAFPAPFQHSGGEGAAGADVLVKERRFDPRHAAEDILLSTFAPPSVVVDDEFEIMQFRGSTDDYLQHGSGRASLSVLDMAREGLAADIRKVVDKARVSGSPVVDEHVRYRVSGETRRVILRAVPFAGTADERYYLIIFEAPPGAGEGGPPTEVKAHGGALEPDESEKLELQRELDATRDYMQALVQDKEAALEELRAANEEIQSSNEELQSINEELETAKEELQSTNEELRTVNEELEHRNLQLSRANDDLSNLLRAVNVPTIMVGRDLRIRRFTPGTERVMSLITGDIGRPITDIALRLDVPDLGDLLTQVIENITVAERELRDEDGHWYAMRIRPYQTEENRIEGAVITLFDVHEERSVLAKYRQAEQLSEGINSMLATLQGDRRPEQVVKAILAEGAKAVGADAAVVLSRAGHSWVVRHAHGAVRGASGTELSDDEVPQAPIAEATKRPVAVQSGEGSPKILPPGFGDTAIVAVPLVAHSRFTGVLLFAWKQHPQPPDEVQVDFVSKIGALVSLTLGEC